MSALIQRTLAGNAYFARLWREGAVKGHAEDRKTVIRPGIGEITLDCDVLTDTDTDLKMVIFTASPGSEDESRLKARPRHRSRPATPLLVRAFQRGI